MKYKQSIIVGLVLACMMSSSCAIFDIGLEYKSSMIHENSSFTVGMHEDVTFKKSDTHVFEYVEGRHHSRVTTAHGYTDRILIEFKDNPKDPSGECTLLRGARVGYRRDFLYGLRSIDDLWVKIIRHCNTYYIEGAVKIMVMNDDGTFNDSIWDVIVIEPQEIKNNNGKDCGC